MKKILKRTGIVLASIIVLLIIIITVLFWNELRSLASIKKLDDYGMFQMTYYGDYGFDDFLLVGAESDRDIEDFVTNRLLKGLPFELNITDGGCTVFVSYSPDNELFFGRNFDFDYAPSMQVFTNPKNGYTSVSTVNLAFIGYSEDNLPSGLNFSSFLTLASPFLPFDGMNEKGLAIALLAVPEAQPPFDNNKIMLNTTTAIRLVLDYASTVDEAVELLRQYNIYFSAGVYCHYLIADATGQSALVEYFEGDIKVIKTNDNFQIASNFIAYNNVNIGEGYCEFERYDTVYNKITGNNGVLSVSQVIELLAEVGGFYDGVDRLQWTVVYNLTALDGIIFANRNTGNLIPFKLNTE